MKVNRTIYALITSLIIVIIILYAAYINKIKKTWIMNDNNYPVMIEDFKFDMQNFEKSVNLPNFNDGYYEVGVIDKTGKIPLDINYNGVITIEFKEDDSIILEEDVSLIQAKLFNGELDNKYYKALIFYFFTIPIQSFREGLTINIKVKKVDSQFINNDNLILYISKRSVP
jgi:hypothetical protein